jgi:hypothetical protein
MFGTVMQASTRRSRVHTVVRSTSKLGFARGAIVGNATNRWSQSFQGDNQRRGLRKRCNSVTRRPLTKSKMQSNAVTDAAAHLRMVKAPNEGCRLHVYSIRSNLKHTKLKPYLHVLRAADE